MKNTNNISTCCNDNCCDECIYVTTVNVSCYRTTLPVGESCFVRATPKPDNATNKKVVWSSSNNAIATVNPDSGLVTGQGVGIAVITATAVDRGIVTGTYVIEIVPYVFVQSLTVLNPELTMHPDERERVNILMTPSNATNFSVKWCSSNECVATVDGLGVVKTHNVGEAIITVRTTDDSNLCATCRVKVEPILVESISLCPTSKTMIVGCEVSINEQVLPENATDKSLTWHSSKPSVAKVSNTGWVTAVSEGEAIITATSTNGKVSNECKITVKKEKVLIRRDDEGMLEVVLSSGQIWKCIDRDIIFWDCYEHSASEQNMLGNLTSRCAYNYFEHYDPPYTMYGQKEYTDDELKLLYVIDPHGVARYVQKYSVGVPGGLETSLQYKDRIFKLLFKKEPKYFDRDIAGNWDEVQKNSITNFSTVLSESELIFGNHPIYDATALFDFLTLSIDLVCAVLNVGWFKKATNEIISKFTKYFVAGITVSFGVVERDLAACAEGIGSALIPDVEDLNLGWASSLISIYNDLQELGESLTGIPEYNKAIYKYCYNSCPYDVFIQFKNQEQYKMKDICQALELLS